VLRGLDVKVLHSRDGRKAINQMLAAHRGAPVVAVGVLGSKASTAHGSEGLTTADVAAVNEFGLGVPERPFMRQTFEQRLVDIQKLARGLEQRVLQKTMTVDGALQVMGAAAVGYVRATIDSGVEPGNAPSTIKQKGSSKTLVNTGQLKGSISSEVRRGR
jgi:hypothetical protein